MIQVNKMASGIEGIVQPASSGTSPAAASVAMMLRRQTRGLAARRMTTLAQHPGLGVWSATHSPALLYHRTAMRTLGADAKSGAAAPVVLVDLLRLQPGSEGAWEEHASLLNGMDGYRQVASLSPTENSVLLGRPEMHEFDRIAISHFTSAAQAVASLTDPQLMSLRQRATGSGSVILRCAPSAALAGIPTFEEAGGEASPIVSDACGQRD